MITNAVKIFAITLLSLTSLTAFAGTLDDYPEVRDCMNDDNLLLTNYWGCLNEGYELAEIEVHPVYYFLPPEGEHLAYTVVIPMFRQEAGQEDQGTANVHITCDVHDDGEGNLHIVKLTVTRSMAE
ncbi:hypothetical protein SCOR_25110 [Sulfidibacter corallicola]|uniref:Uncharacterized protein n=1 Tax=Sulfidibacter corallicola TaxID=2818388 RepID=A0A8A4U0P3_SULCO|nr:hypothetical protein [Sulfidibacter corallicola]QTD52315.1 hypothetical protein J3U87_07555 [Sulfidibacter corallicola]